MQLKKNNILYNVYVYTQLISLQKNSTVIAKGLSFYVAMAIWMKSSYRRVAVPFLIVSRIWNWAVRGRGKEGVNGEGREGRVGGREEGGSGW